MTDVLLIAAAFAYVALIVRWAWRHVEITGVERAGLILHPSPPDPKVPLPALTVIIPAKDEAGDIRACVASVLRQAYPRLSVVVVDDRSTDDTGMILRQLAARDDRLAIKRVDVLPDRWLGKSHACWIGTRKARTEWLLFLDADARLAPDALATAVGYASRHDIDLLSLMPRSGNVGFWEHVLIPLAAAMITLWYGVTLRPDRAVRQPFVSGAFLLIRREAYARSGGHQAVRTALIEDLPLAAAIQAAGGRVFSCLGKHLLTVRMYQSRAEVVAGWKRIYVGTLSVPQMVLCLVSLGVESLLPMIVLVTAGAAVSTGSAGPWWWFWLIASGVHLVTASTVSVRFFSLAGCNTRYLIWYPLSCLGVGWILGLAIAARLRSSRLAWKETTYDLSADTIKS